MTTLLGSIEFLRNQLLKTGRTPNGTKKIFGF
jgi:hypothetical protein